MEVARLESFEAGGTKSAATEAGKDRAQYKKQDCCDFCQERGKEEVGKNMNKMDHLDWKKLSDEGL